jgi:glycosyltransferase involved in cell wall biosynthesis
MKHICQYVESRAQISNYSQKDIQSLPLVSIITVVYNNAQYIKDSIQSVLSQDYARLEYVVIDGGSTDGTLAVIDEYRDKISVFITEPDKGIYDALNKGIRFAKGDVIAILHSDDIFYDESVVSSMMERMSAMSAEFCFSDLIIVDKSGTKVLRYYMAHYFKRWMFRIGWLPPHPTCFMKRSLFDEFGLYSTDYEIAGDFDFLVRIFYARKIKWTYLDRITVKMRYGGASNSGWKNKINNFNEISNILHENNIWTLKIFQVFRYIIRVVEIFVRPRHKWTD